jgi:hypothetical protein
MTVFRGDAGDAGDALPSNIDEATFSASQNRVTPASPGGDAGDAHDLGGNAEFGQNSTLRLKAFSCMACKETS